VIENFLQGLTKVKGRNGRWTACCPAHDDKSPSLAIRQTEDGRILLHCFGGCSVHSIVTAVGMDMTDLFPPREGNYSPIKSAFTAADLLRVIAFESSIVYLVASDIAKGKELSSDDIERVKIASERIEEARRYANV